MIPSVVLSLWLLCVSSVIGAMAVDATSAATPATVTDAATRGAVPDARLDYTPGQAPTFWSIATAESVMARWPDYNLANHASWTYVHGYTLYGFDMLYRATGDRRYFNFVKRYIDKHIDE